MSHTPGLASHEGHFADANTVVTPQEAGVYEGVIDRAELENMRDRLPAMDKKLLESAGSIAYGAMTTIMGRVAPNEPNLLTTLEPWVQPKYITEKPAAGQGELVTASDYMALLNPAVRENELAFYDPADRTIAGNPHNIAQEYGRSLAETAIEKNPGDFAIGGLIGVVGHELGHGVMHGMSLAASKYSGEIVLESVLANNPAYGFTGTWRTDKASIDESHGNAWGRALDYSTFAALDYPLAARNDIWTKVAHRAIVTGPKDTNQLDYIRQPNDEALHERVVSARLRSGTPENALQEFPGILGYNLPLTPKGLAAYYEKAGAVIKNPPSQAVSYNGPKNWAKDVAKQRHPEIDAHIKDLVQQRKQELSAGRRKSFLPWLHKN